MPTTCSARGLVSFIRMAITKPARSVSQGAPSPAMRIRISLGSSQIPASRTFSKYTTISPVVCSRGGGATATTSPSSGATIATNSATPAAVSHPKKSPWSRCSTTIPRRAKPARLPPVLARGLTSINMPRGPMDLTWEVFTNMRGNSAAWSCRPAVTMSSVGARRNFPRSGRKTPLRCTKTAVRWIA